MRRTGKETEMVWEGQDDRDEGRGDKEQQWENQREGKEEVEKESCEGKQAKKREGM